jgi:hypothetical protein
MRSNTIDAAAARLREADPAVGVTGSPATIEAALNAVLAESVEPVGLDLVADELLSEPSRRSRLSIALVAAVVLAIAGVAVGISRSRPHLSQQAVGSVNGPRSSLPNLPQKLPRKLPREVPRASLTPSGGSPDDPNYAPALTLANNALSTLPTLPDSTSTPSAPVKVLLTPGQGGQDSNVVLLSAFWTAPGTTVAAQDYFMAHPPVHTKLDGFSNTNDPADPVNVSFVGAPGRYSALWANFQIVPFHAGVALRADVEVSWYSTKSAQERIGTVSSADVVVDRSNSGGDGLPRVSNVDKTLTGATAQALAAAVDAAKLEPAGNVLRSCPIDFGYTDRLTFTAGARTIVVLVTVGGCEGMSETVDRVTQPPMAGTVDPLLMKDLGLPAGYGD